MEEKRVLPSSPLTTQIAPHIPSLLSLLYLTPNASPLCFGPTSLPLASFFPGLHLFLLLSRAGGESCLAQRLWAAAWSFWGLTGRLQGPAAHSRQGVLGRGMGLAEGTSQGNQLLLEIEKPFFSAGYQE